MVTPVSLKIPRGGLVTSYDSTDFFHGNRLFYVGGSYYAKTIANTCKYIRYATFFWDMVILVIFEFSTLKKESLRPYHLEYWSLCLEQCQLQGSVFTRPGELSHKLPWKDHHFIAGKIHYFDWAIFNCFL